MFILKTRFVTHYNLPRHLRCGALVCRTVHHALFITHCVTGSARARCFAWHTLCLTARANNVSSLDHSTTRAGHLDVGLTTTPCAMGAIHRIFFHAHSLEGATKKKLLQRRVASARNSHPTVQLRCTLRVISQIIVVGTWCCQFTSRPRISPRACTKCGIDAIYACPAVRTWIFLTVISVTAHLLFECLRKCIKLVLGAA